MTAADVSMSPLEELEAAFRARSKAAGEKQVLVTMNIDATVVHALAPRLQSAGMSLSELVRAALRLRVQSMTSNEVPA